MDSATYLWYPVSGPVLADADGNGLELYVDRPRESWPRQDGQIVGVELLVGK
jgi:catechol-2,3-dioxygenase